MKSTREGVLAYVSDMRGRQKASHLKSINMAFDWLDEHPVKEKNGINVVEINGVDAAIIFVDFQYGACLRFQPLCSTDDIGAGAGMITSQNF